MSDAADFVAAHRADTEALLAAIIAIDSVTGRETELARYLSGWLDARAMKSALEPCLGRFNVISEVGAGTAAIVFSGHLDTVPANVGRWSSAPLTPTVKDGRMHGLGASDLKGSIAAAYVASWYLSQRNIPLPIRCITAMTVEEETTGAGTHEYVARAIASGALIPDQTVAVITEPTGLRHVSLGSRGAVFADVRVVGQGGHGSRPQEAKNPAAAVVRMIAAIDPLVANWRTRFRDPHFPETTVTVTSLRGGDGSRHNVIPHEAGFLVDCRPAPGLDGNDFQILKEELIATMKRAAGDGFALDVDWRYPRPGHKVAVDAPIVQIACEALREELGVEAEFRYTPAGNDACYFGQHGISALNKLGPGDPEQAHRVDESIALENVHHAAVLYARIAERYADHVRPAGHGSTAANGNGDDDPDDYARSSTLT